MKHWDRHDQSESRNDEWMIDGRMYLCSYVQTLIHAVRATGDGDDRYGTSFRNIKFCGFVFTKDTKNVNNN